MTFSAITKKIIPLTLLGALIIFFGAYFWNNARAQTATPSANPSSTLTGTTLQDQITAKNKELQLINQQLQATQETLKSTQQQKATLQNQVSTLDNNIKSLSLNIQSDTLTTQQLQLEIEQLNGNLADITASIGTKEAAIKSLLKELQKNDATNGNLLVTFLKQSSLADGVLEAQTLHNLRGQLNSDIGNLTDLHQQYNNQLQQSNSKKVQVVAHQNDLLNRKSLVQDQEQQKQALLASTKGQESLYQKQVADLQKQQQQIASEIESIDALLRTKIDPSTLPAFGAGVLLMPVQGDTVSDITQGYGATAFARSEYVHHWHNGLDLAASIGTPLLAAADGTVAAQGNEDLYCPHGAYGKFIVINHNNGLTTLYGHLSKILVSAGQVVKRGQVIGYTGATGSVTGPHLHFTVFAQSTYYLSNSRSCGPLPQGGDLNPYGYLF